MTSMRSRWSAVGVAVAVTLGTGGIGLVRATSPSDAVTFVPITPCRVLDTRPDFNLGPRATPLGPGDTHTVAAADGECTGKVPAAATALSLNVTAVDATLLTFLTIWAAGEPRPNASSLNPSPGEPPTPNAVTTGVDSSGEFDIYNLQGTVHVLADINGYYVDHDHDDRYYTKGQSDGRYHTKSNADARYAAASHAHDTTLAFGLPVQGARLSDGATIAGAEITLPSTGTPSMSVGFGIPSGHVVGDPIIVTMALQSTPNCAVRFEAEGLAGPFPDPSAFFNTEYTIVGSPDGIVEFGPAPAGHFNAATVISMSNRSGEVLTAGASMELRLRRMGDDPADTCGPVAIAAGISVEY